MNSARIATVVAAIGSILAMLRIGFRGDATVPTLLLVLFIGWVLSPFLALLAADRVSTRWAGQPRTALRWLMLLIPLASVALYGYAALRPPSPKPASTFLLVPLGSWLGLVITLAIARSTSSSRPSAP